MKNIPEETRKKIARNNMQFKRAFASTAGKEVLRDLIERFYEGTSIVKGDPYLTHAKEGAREVVIYILDRIKRTEKIDEGLDEQPAGDPADI